MTVYVNLYLILYDISTNKYFSKRLSSDIKIMNKLIWLTSLYNVI